MIQAHVMRLFNTTKQAEIVMSKLWSQMETIYGKTVSSYIDAFTND